MAYQSLRAAGVMRELAQPMLKNQYGRYLMKVIDEMKNKANTETFVK